MMGKIIGGIGLMSDFTHHDFVGKPSDSAQTVSDIVLAVTP